MNQSLLMTVVFFVALIWYVAWLSSITTKAHLESKAELAEARKEAERNERRRMLAELEAEFYGDDNPKHKEPKHASSKPKRTVKFVDAMEEEIEEPKGRHIYDPIAHKVVFVPAE